MKTADHAANQESVEREASDLAARKRAMFDRQTAAKAAWPIVHPADMLRSGRTFRYLPPAERQAVGEGADPLRLLLIARGIVLQGGITEPPVVCLIGAEDAAMQTVRLAADLALTDAAECYSDEDSRRSRVGEFVCVGAGCDWAEGVKGRLVVTVTDPLPPAWVPDDSPVVEVADVSPVTTSAGDALISECLDMIRGEQVPSFGYPTAAAVIDQELAAFAAALPLPQRGASGGGEGWRVVPPHGPLRQRFNRLAPYLCKRGCRVEKQGSRQARSLIMFPQELLPHRLTLEARGGWVNQQDEQETSQKKKSSKEKLI